MLNQKNFNQKKFGPKKCWSKNVDPKKCWVKKNQAPKKIFGQK